MKYFAIIFSVLFIASSAFAATTVVSGHSKDRYDIDNNGYPDSGVTTNGKYVSIYAYDQINWYWDLGDGRVLGTVPSINDLSQAFLTVCTYQVQYRGMFNNDSFLDSGWIINNINCSGSLDNGQYNYLIVHQSDPRYNGNPDWSIWGTWEYQVLTESGVGNLIRPMTPAGLN